MSSLKLFNHSIGQSSLIKDIRATNSVMVTLDNTASPAVTLEIKHHDVIVLETVKSCIQNPRKFTKVPWSSVQDVYPDFDEMLSIYLAVFDCDLVESTTPDGLLLLGASGTGKTTAAAAWAAHIGAAFFGISATIMSSCVNQIEETLILALETVRRIAQTGRHVVVLFDEFDRLVPKDQFAGANAALSRSIALILKHQLAMYVVSGLPIFVFATTCHPDRLDLSDIDRYFLMKSHFRLPDLQQRVRLWNNRWSIEKDVVNVSQKEIQNLADQTSGFAASDIHALFGRAIGLRAHEYQLSTTWVQGEEGVLRPARANEQAMIIDNTCKQLAGQRTTRLNPIDPFLLLKLIRTGGYNGSPWPRANMRDVNKEFEDWMKSYSQGI